MSERDGERRKYGMRMRATETGSWQKRGRGWETETTREGNVATLLIENSSALAILIKSRKSLARSIGQTGKAPIGLFALWQWSLAVPTLYAISTFHALALFLLFEIFESIVAKETNQSYFVRRVGNTFFSPLMKHWLKIFKSYLIYYNFCYNCKRERILCLLLTNFSF